MSLKITIEDCKGLKPLYDKAKGKAAMVLAEDGITVAAAMAEKTEVLVPLHKITSDILSGIANVMRIAEASKSKTVVIVFSSCLKKIGIIAME